jgi:hypothetical protein
VKLEAQVATVFVSIVMLMLYVSKTRIDIKCSVAYLTTQLVEPTEASWAKMVRVAMYLNATKTLPLVISSSDLVLMGAADASFAVHRDMKSHTGAMLWMGKHNAPIYATSTKQPLQTRSSTEAEMVALDVVATEVVWMREVLREMGFSQAKPTELQQDNLSCIHLARQGHAGKFSRSIDIKYFWVSEQIERGKVNVSFVRSHEMLADGLTKPLEPTKFRQWRDLVLNVNRSE